MIADYNASYQTLDSGFLNASYDEKDLMLAIDLHIENIYGRRRLPLPEAIIVTLLYVTIFLSGFIGNALTCLVIITNRYMQTTTNLYLFNLACADLMILITGIPQELIVIWDAYPWKHGVVLCYLRNWASETFNFASILTITIFTVERYFAVCHPIWLRARTFLGRVVKVIVAIWIISSLCAVSIAFQYDVLSPIPYPDGLPHSKLAEKYLETQSEICNMSPDKTIAHTIEIATLVYFVIPMTIIIVLYVKIAMAIRLSIQISQRRGSGNSSEQRTRLSSCASSTKSIVEPGSPGDIPAPEMRMSVVKMLVVVCAAFFICWAPFHTQRVIAIHYPQIPQNIFTKLYIFSGLFYYTNSMINPCLYSAMSLRYRLAFRRTMRSFCRRKESAKQRQIAKVQLERQRRRHAQKLAIMTLKLSALQEEQSRSAGGNHPSRNDEHSMNGTGLLPKEKRDVSAQVGTSVMYLQPHKKPGSAPTIV